MNVPGARANGNGNGKHHADPVALVLSHLEGVRPAGDRKWMARCPAHDDRHASLSITVAPDDRVLLNCHAGCRFPDMCAAMGLRAADLSPTPINGRHHSGAKTNGKPAKVYPSARAALDAAAWNVPNAVFKHAWPYHDRDGTEVMCVGRWDLPGGDKTCRPVHLTTAGWKVGDPPGLLPLYNLPGLSEGEPVFVCEGEKASDAASDRLGLCATTSAHGAKAAERTDWRPLAGRNVVILPDNDAPGEQYARDVTRLLMRLDPPATVRVVRLPGLPRHGDVVEFIDAGGTAEQLLGLVEQATPLAAPEAGGGADTWHALKPVSAAELLEADLPLHAPIIHGLLRQYETMNLIASSKVGKSWLALMIALSVATRRTLFGLYPTEQVNVLVIDNELHSPTIGSRLRQVAGQMGLTLAEYGHRVDFIAVRDIELRDEEQALDIHGIGPMLRHFKPGRYGLIILDAMSRFYPPGTDENNNGHMTHIYNVIDRYAKATRAAFLCVHHASKGVQGNKSITDTGRGAGSISGAVDSHVVLRDHEQDGVAVLDAKLRSWPPVEPTCLEWSHPLWKPAPHLDPNRLRTERRKNDRQVQAPAPTPAPVEDWDVQKFVARFLTADGRTEASITTDAKKARMSGAEAKRLLTVAQEQGLVFPWDFGQRAPRKFATTRQPLATTARGSK